MKVWEAEGDSGKFFSETQSAFISERSISLFLGFVE